MQIELTKQFVDSSYQKSVWFKKKSDQNQSLKKNSLLIIKKNLKLSFGT